MSFSVRVAAASALVLLFAGCGGRSQSATDKAGGPKTPTVLRLADSDDNTQPSSAAVQHFAREVEQLSGRSIRVRIVYGAAGSETPRVEEQTIRMVRAGSFDLGVTGARAWDEVGATAFQALQAPFLITSTTLLNRVLESPIAAQMLTALKHENVVGLALVPDHLRRPTGLGRALVSLHDFAGAHIRIIPSRTTAALLRALGATPVEISNAQIGIEIRRGHVSGEEMSLFNSPAGATIPANLVLFGKALTFFANESSYRKLDAKHREVVLAAAADTTRWVAKHYPSELVIDRRLCSDRRHIVFARSEDVLAIERAAQPVYSELERDSATRQFIARIRAMKASMAPTPAIQVARACRRVVPSATASGPPLSPSLLNGTYRWVLSAADARAAGQQVNPGDNMPIVSTAVLRNGTWSFSGSDHDGGTYTIHGNRIRFDWPRVASVLVFRLKRNADGTIHLTPVLPMDAGDQFVWAYRPWRRIGPPSDVNAR